MATQYWILKSEPETFSWDTLVKDGRTDWDGVRNHQAKANLMAMKPGDQAFFYHSMSDKALVGLCTISKAHYPDPTDEKWFAVEVKPIRPLKRFITLAEIKVDPQLAHIALVRQGRLSVVPLTKAEFDHLQRLEQG